LKPISQDDDSGAGFWIPKMLERVDYKPMKLGDNSYYVPGVVKNVLEDAGEYDVSVEFRLEGQSIQESIDYPSEAIGPCGEKLTARKDCGSEIAAFP
jgi:hypothetical protein